MLSNLRFSTSPSISRTPQITRITISSPIEKTQKMSLTQSYYLAHTARSKLSKEAAKADHNLRLLVGHANLLDGLMLDLADAEREQESWFNQTVKGAAKASEEPEKPKHIQWADAIPEEAVEDADWEALASDSDSESDDEEDFSYAQSMALNHNKVSTTVTAMEVDEDEDMEDDDEFEQDLTLTRTSSNHPPELMHESDSESEDELMPPSPPPSELQLSTLSEKQRQAIVTTSYYPSEKSDVTQLSPSEEESFLDEGFYLPQRRHPGLVSAISVY